VHADESDEEAYGLDKHPDEDKEVHIPMTLNHDECMDSEDVEDAASAEVGEVVLTLEPASVVGGLLVDDEIHFGRDRCYQLL
jgi:hypothetical protein